MRPSQSLTSCCVAILALSAITSPAYAQAEGAVVEAAQFELSVANIMRGSELVGTQPSRLSWSPDGRTLYFLWKQPHEETQGFYRVSRGGARQSRGSFESLARDQNGQPTAVVTPVTIIARVRGAGSSPGPSSRGGREGPGRPASASLSRKSGGSSAVARSASVGASDAGRSSP